MALTSKQRRGLAEAISYTKYGMWKTGAAKVPVIQLDRLAGFSPKQLRDLVKQIQDAKTEVEVFAKANEDILNQMKSLKDIEKSSLAKLTDAIEEMNLKGKYCTEAEDALISWTSSIEGKVPGIEQIMTPAEASEEGKKAGDLINKIAAEFGAEVASKVEVIIRETKDDLTHYAKVVRSLKILTKTAGIDPNIVKAAGILDAITNVKEWLAGKAVAGWEKITEWAKAFAVRTGLVKDATESIKKFVNVNTKALDKLV